MKIGIIGCGNMGQALLGGIIKKGFISKRNIFCSDKDRKKINSVRLRLGMGIFSSNRELVKRCAVIILAIKPQDVGAVLQEIASLPLGKKLFISVCAGITTKLLEKHLGKVAVIRVMPNMPAKILAGISAISAGKYTTRKDMQLAKSIFSCIGEVVQVKEQLMDAVTAISGSGPAYFFYLTENLIKTARQLGIPHHLARRLAIKTALGSAMLMDKSPKTAKGLRKQVTSKGGTTEAAFKVLKKKAWEDILHQALQAAAQRSKQLKKQINVRLS